MNRWSNLASVVYLRTYSRNDYGKSEKWADTVERVIAGNVRGHLVSEDEINRLRYYMTERKAIPAGRGLWYSGSPNHERLGGAALNNCYVVSSENWQNFILAQDYSMLGGGVGMTVEHKYTSKLPRVKKDVLVVNRETKDADFIVPDSREGWNELTRRVLEAYLETGKSFSFSTVCVRGAGEAIKGFGGIAAGPKPLVEFVKKLSAVLKAREGRKLRPIDAADILCLIGEMVVSGNVRRSALLIAGDCWDKDFLRAKRWDLGNIPTQRAMANFSVMCDDVDDLHPLFWKTYEHGEPFGIINLTNTNRFGRMGEKKNDNAICYNPCAESGLENGEACNLQEIALPNLQNEAEFMEAARLMHRYGKRVAMEPYHHTVSQEVITRNRRIGTGITGCLKSPLFKPEVLDRVYAEIEEENVCYSQELRIPQSIRTTVVKPSGTVSKLLDMDGYEGIHPAFSRYIIQRVRIAANDALLPALRGAGHHIEPEVRFDGSLNHNTLVVSFYVQAPEGYPVADEDWDTWKQLEVVKMVQRHWCDQSASVTVYYKKEEIPQLKAWLAENLKHIKTISFLCHSDHGFKQAPKEKITAEQYENLSKNIKPLDLTNVASGDSVELDECASGACPIK